MKRVALYVRVSTQEQKNHGLSVDSQIQALKEFCKDNGYIEAGLYNDAGISARKRYTKRPALLDLLEDCKTGKIDLIIFTKLDRWFRSVGDYYEVQRQLDQYKIPWRAIWEDYETETSSGIFKVNIMLSVAQSEADRTSERIKSVNEFKRIRGDYVGKAPTGYKLQKKDLVIDEDQREAVSVFFEAYLKGYNIVYAVTKAKPYGFNVSRETASKMLKNPVYKGEAYGGYKCEPYITEDQWNQIQIYRPKTHKVFKDKDTRIYYFTGIIKCPLCNRFMHGSTKGMSRGDKRYIYKTYRCIGHENLYCDNQRSITENKLEEYLINNLDQELKNYEISCKSDPIETVDRRSEITNLENKLKRIGDRYEDGDITKDEYKAKRSMILDQINEIKASEMKDPTPASLPHNWLEIYQDLDDLHKKLFWSSILKGITLDRAGNIELFF